MQQMAIELDRLGKMYKLYRSPKDRVLDALGLSRLQFWRDVHFQEFWAIREIDLKIRRGERVGIIGSNGAGKSTLLKIVTGNSTPTVGRVRVNGSIQALMEIGTGFHPEFTGIQNIRASLTLQGLSQREISEKEQEIIEFAEIGDFITQPTKIYSAGMYARLAFSTATAIEPEILIIDEVLGAGDAYFSSKCIKRMQAITEDSGATVLFVSHDLGSVQRLCNSAIWLDRGKMVMKGRSLEVVKAYQEHVQKATDKKLKAKNLKKQTKNLGLEQLESYSEALIVTIVIYGDGAGTCDVTEIQFIKDGEVEEVLRIGDAQDTSAANSCHLVNEAEQWSVPQKADKRFYRSISVGKDQKFAVGQAVFYDYALYDTSAYRFNIKYRCTAVERGEIYVVRQKDTITDIGTLTGGGEGWKGCRVDIDFEKFQPLVAAGTKKKDMAEQEGTNPASNVRRWPSEGSLLITRCEIVDSKGNESTIFNTGQFLAVRLTVQAQKTMDFRIRPAITIYRPDGVLVTNHPAEESVTRHLSKNDTLELQLDFPQLNLGAGRYVISVSLFKDKITEEGRYDLIDRSFEFEVVTDDERFKNAVFHHDSAWKTRAMETGRK